MPQQSGAASAKVGVGLATVLSVAALAACESVGHDDSGGAGGDVVIATGMSRGGEHETHYVECGPDPRARLGEYRVVIPPALDYGGLPDGSPCPDGPREPMPHDEHPELSAELSKALNAPLPYEGGNLDQPCGTWGTDDPAEARRLLAECPPLTRGHLPEHHNRRGTHP